MNCGHMVIEVIHLHKEPHSRHFIIYQILILPLFTISLQTSVCFQYNLHNDTHNVTVCTVDTPRYVPHHNCTHHFLYLALQLKIQGLNIPVSLQVPWHLLVTLHNWSHISSVTLRENQNVPHRDLSRHQAGCFA